MTYRTALALVPLFLVLGCQGPAGVEDGGRPADAGALDAGAGADGGGSTDAGLDDAGTDDAGADDAGTDDAGTCAPATCAQLGAECGDLDGGCGATLHCGSCALPEQCGALSANSCDVPATCTNLCLQQVSCPGGATTVLRGTVYAPNGVDPVAGARVYVPNAPVPARVPGVGCDRCDAALPGSALMQTVTAADGTFSLSDVPVGANIPLVVTKGRWRRQSTVPLVTACVANVVSPALTRLPKNQTEGDLPLLAFSTGAVDALECVLRKIGVDDSEFTAPSGTGRIHLYQGLTDHNSLNATTSFWASGGAKATGSPYEDQLWTTQAALDQYDAVFFPCQADQANPNLRSAAVHQNLVHYVNAGGRVFATHYSYIWLNTTPPFSSTAAWNVQQPSPADQTASVNRSFDGGVQLAGWLSTVGASTVPGQVPLQVLRHDYDSVVPPSQSWLTVDDATLGAMSVLYTFDAPVGAPPAQQCGRVLFNDFHVENVSFASTIGAIFPSECPAGPMTPQEKLLEYFIFELGDCLGPTGP